MDADGILERVFLKTLQLDIDVVLTPGLNIVVGDDAGQRLFARLMRARAGLSGGEECPGLGNVWATGIYPCAISPRYVGSDLFEEVTEGVGSCPGPAFTGLIEKLIADATAVSGGEGIEFPDLRDTIEQLVDSAINAMRQKQEMVNERGEERVKKGAGCCGNILKGLMPTADDICKIEYGKSSKYRHVEALGEIDDFLSASPFIEYRREDMEALLGHIERVYEISNFERFVRSAIGEGSSALDALRGEAPREKGQTGESRGGVREYEGIDSGAGDAFCRLAGKIAAYSGVSRSPAVNVRGNRIYVENTLELDRHKVFTVIRGLIAPHRAIASLGEVRPEDIISLPDGRDSGAFESELYKGLVRFSGKHYRILDRTGVPFGMLDKGSRVLVMLDILNGYSPQAGPLVIDLPAGEFESYAPEILKKGPGPDGQIIFITHCGELPAGAEKAFNLITCGETEGVITLRSAKSGRVLMPADIQPRSEETPRRFATESSE